MAATIQKCSGFTFKEILCQPYKRSYRQALAKFLCGDLMIGRITKHWYCRDQRVNGMSAGCIDCFKEKNLKVEESEEHLIFDCVTTKKCRKWFWKHINEADAYRCFSRAYPNRLEALFATQNKETWALLGEYAYKIWCRPCQAWRRHLSKS